MKFNLSETLPLILEYITELKQRNNTRWYLEKWQYNAEGKLLFNIRMAGKTALFQVHSDEVLSNKRLLNGFSKDDIKRILSLIYEESTKPKYVIVASRKEGHQRMVTVQHLITKKTYTFSLEAILKNDEFIHGFGSDDLLKMGYFSGLDSNMPGQESTMFTVPERQARKALSKKATDTQHQLKRIRKERTLKLYQEMSRLGSKRSKRDIAYQLLPEVQAISKKLGLPPLSKDNEHMTVYRWLLSSPD